MRERQWKHLLSMTMVNLGIIMQRQRKWALAQVYFEESLALDRELVNRERLCQTLEGLVVLLRQQGAYEQAWSYLHEGLELARQMRNRRMLGEPLLETGELYLQTSHIVQAEKAFKETLEEMPEGHYSLEMGAFYGLARVAAAKGNIHEARRLGHACLSHSSTSSYHRLAEVQSWLDGLI